MPLNSIIQPKKVTPKPRRKKADIVQFVAVINGNSYTFADRSQLDAFMVKYSSANSIFELSLFRVEFFNILENAKS